MCLNRKSNDQSKNMIGEIRHVLYSHPSAWDLMLKIDKEIQVHFCVCVGVIQETRLSSSYRTQQHFGHQTVKFYLWTDKYGCSRPTVTSNSFYLLTCSYLKNSVIEVNPSVVNYFLKKLRSLNIACYYYQQREVTAEKIKLVPFKSNTLNFTQSFPDTVNIHNTTLKFCNRPGSVDADDCNLYGLDDWLFFASFIILQDD